MIDSITPRTYTCLVIRGDTCVGHIHSGGTSGGTWRTYAHSTLDPECYTVGGAWFSSKLLLSMNLFDS
jgi:hypothetical protein